MWHDIAQSLGLPEPLFWVGLGCLVVFLVCMGLLWYLFHTADTRDDIDRHGN